MEWSAVIILAVLVGLVAIAIQKLIPIILLALVLFIAITALVLGKFRPGIKE